MKKTLAILLTLIILITSVSYDSFAYVTDIIDDTMKPIGTDTTAWTNVKNQYNIPGSFINNVYHLKYKINVLNPNNTFAYSIIKDITIGTKDLITDIIIEPWITTIEQSRFVVYTNVNHNDNFVAPSTFREFNYFVLETTSTPLNLVDVQYVELDLIISRQNVSFSQNNIDDYHYNYSSEYSPDYIPTPDEYLYITLPREGFKTIDKFMTYNVMYSIAAENINDVTLKINDENNVPFTEAPLIESFDALNHTATLENGYLKGQVQIWADYKGTVVGPVGVNISVLNTATNRELKVSRNVEIMPFTDADGDGIDDNTGEDQFYRPDIPGLDDLDLDLGTAVDTIRTVIPNINNGVANIVALLAVMFSWLPDQVSSLIILIMILIAITTIIKILRG